MDRRTIEIDIDRLYQDLIEHFGTSQFWCTQHAPNRSWGPHHDNFIAGSGCRINVPMETGVPIAAGALGDIDTAYQLGNYDRLVTLALGEGFELTEYEVT